MSQIIINTGNVANDGLGTPLRNAFNQVNYNFTQLFDTGPAGSNIVIANNSITVTNTNGNLRLATNGVGSIVPAANFVPDIPNVRSIGAGTNRFNTVYAQYINANTGTFAGNVYVTGNLQVTGNVVTVNYSNLSVANSNITLATGAANAAQASGGGLLIPIAGANFTYDYSANSWMSTIAITAPTFIGDGSNLANVIANVQANALLGNTFSNSINYSNLTSFGQISALSITGNVSTTGNVYANAIVGNRVTANYLYGNGSNITNITANAIVGNVPFALVANTAYVANLAALATQAINSDTALFAINANLASWANTATIAQTANAATYAIQADNANSAVVAGMAYQLAPTANLSIVGNITTDSYFIGNGSQLTGVVSSYGNSNVAAYLPVYSGNLSAQNIQANGGIFSNAKVISIADSGANGIVINGAGIVAGSNVATILYDNSVFGWTVNQGWIPAANITYNLGRSTRYWNNFYAVNVNATDAAITNSLSITNNISVGGNVIAANVSATSLNSNSIVYVGANGLLTTDSAFTYIDNEGELTLNVDYLNSPGIFTNDIYGQGNLILHPDTGNFSSYLDVYLTTGTDIHIAANSENIIIGRDSGANVTVGVDGNVTVRADLGTPYNWQFGADGNLTTPANAIIRPLSDDLTLDASSGNVYVKSKGHTFLFDANGVGRFVMPDQGKIAADSNLSINVGDWANSAGSLWSFADNGIVTLADNTEMGTIEGANTFGFYNSNANTEFLIELGSSNTWNFDGASGNLTLPSGGNLIVSGAIVSSGASPAPSLSGFSSVSAITLSASGNVTSGNILASGLSLSGNVLSNLTVDGYIYSAGNITTGANLITQTGYIYAGGNITGSNLITAGSGGNITLTGGNITGANVISAVTLSSSGNVTGARFYGDVGNVTYQQTNTFYVDPGRTQNYTPTGSQIQPFFTVTAAITAATAGGYIDSNPAFIVLMENITEDITLKPGIWLTSLGTGTHGSPVITGTVTITSSTGSTVSNHYSISNLRIVAPTNGHGILFTGTAPQRLYVRDMWIDASGTGDGIYMDNTGTASTLHLDIAHLTHSGSGDVYCINVTKGNCYVTDIETTGSTQVSAVQDGAVMTIDGSELDAVGDVVCETYGTGSLTITNSLIVNTQANSNGIKINSAGSTVTVGQCLFNIPSGTGSAIWYNPAATLFGSNIAFASISFYPGSNSTIDPRLVPIPLAVAVGTIASPILYGDITSYAVAQDWDLIDNNTSALSFDTTGKAGIINIVTTNSAEGVTMSGYANVTGNITGGNIVTANRVISTPTALANLTAVAGGRAFINNANLVAAGNFGALVGSGGSNTVPVWSDGSNWYIG